MTCTRSLRRAACTRACARSRSRGKYAVDHAVSTQSSTD
jgi:hypothetical protein